MKKLKCILSLFWLKCESNLSSLCWTIQSPWWTCLTTTGLPDILGFSVWKLKWILFILGLKFGSSWLVITSELTIAGPCKTHGQHVLQQQGYQKYLRKSHTIHYNLYTIGTPSKNKNFIFSDIEPIAFYPYTH